MLLALSQPWEITNHHSVAILFYWEIAKNILFAISQGWAIVPHIFDATYYFILSDLNKKLLLFL